MHPKLKLALLCRSNRQGFALPLAIGLGLIMILVGTLMVVRSGNDQVNAYQQKATAKVLGIGESGISRSISTLNTGGNRLFLQLNYDPLNTHSTSSTSDDDNYLGPDGTPDSNDETTTAVDQWNNPPSSLYIPPCLKNNAGSITLPSNLLTGTVDSGSYTLLAYRYRDPDGTANNGDEMGYLLLQGTQGDTTAQQQALSRLYVSFQVKQTTVPNSFPGLYASDSINLGNNDVLKASGTTGNAANVVCKNCTVTSCSNGEPTAAALSTAVGQGANSIIQGDTYITDPNLPAVPTAPVGATNLGAINSSQTITAGNYIVSSITLNGNDTLTIDSSGGAVKLFVTGNITMSGNAKIIHSGTSDKFAIFGQADDGDSTSDQSFTINGGASAVNVFIYAPDATMGINGGSSDEDIKGAVWVREWNGSSSNVAEIAVPGNIDDLLGSTYGVSFQNVGVQVYQSGSIATWSREEAN
jgi:hypothetical protein